MNSEILNKYADLLLQVGVNVQKGQNVLIKTEPYHHHFANLLAEKAYQLGAKYVDMSFATPGLTKARLAYSTEENLSFVPEYVKAFSDEWAHKDSCLLNVRGSENPDWLADVDQDRNAIIAKAMSDVAEKMRKFAMSDFLKWNVCNVPTPAWGAKVFGGEASAENEKKLWESLIPILRLDQEDPVAAWRQNGEMLFNRANKLNELKLKAVHFKAPNTDLTVEIVNDCGWAGGKSLTPDGQVFVANLPTEEIFTTPNWRKTSGKVRVTKPVEVLGKTVENSWFEFKDGKVTDYGAEKGKEQLDTFFKIDEQARYLGEVALVDSSSPIYKSNTVFHSILLDENASCHIALGAGYTNDLAKEDLSKDQLSERGVNQSILHTDFMIGSDEMNVTGIGHDGTETPILKQGKFTDLF